MPSLPDAFRRAALVAICCAAFTFAGRHALPAAPTATPEGPRHVTIDAPPERAIAWRKVLQRIPARWRAERAVVVREVDEAELLAATKEPDDAVSRAGSLSVVDGFYRNVGRRAPVLILLSAALMREAAELVLMHEYAHYVWDELLSSEDRQEFRRVWRRQRERGQLVSRYAEESPDEGFAEAVSHYVLRPETLRRRDAGAYAFLERCSAPEEREPADRG